MGLALEEPRNEDESREIDGVRVAFPADVADILRIYGDATIDHDPRWRGTTGYFVRFVDRPWRC